MASSRSEERPMGRVESLEELVAQQFAVAEQAQVLALLLSYGSRPHEREPDRVRWVIVALAHGSLERVRRLLATAQRDYRNVLIGDPGYHRRLEAP
jgi:hypothetical protein